jgi:Sec-independent protein secretion pathway component TatC
MFYLSELVFRVKFFFVSFVLTAFLCYCYKESLLLIFSLSLLNNFSDALNSFIYTHPFELFKIHLYATLLLTGFLMIPLFFIQILDFLKSSLTQSEYKKGVKVIFQLFFFILFVNIIAFLYFLPTLWNFFKNFNFENTSTKTLNFFFELRVEEYFNFLIDFLSLINILILLFVCLFCIVCFFGLSNLINLKKLFVFINILFATLLSPPDVYSQMLCLFLLHLFFEGLVFFSIYTLKLNSSYEKLA